MSTTVIEEEEENIVGRASIAALDLPIEYAGNIESISKSQSTPNNYDCKTNQEKGKGKGDLSSPPLVDVLHRAHSLDSGLEKIVSVATLEPLHLHLTSQESNKSEIKEQVLVPARNVLIKMPFYSTPLSFEATNNAFRDFMGRLNEMGFTKQAEAALVATNAESVEAAVEFIMNNPDALFHRYIENHNNNNQLLSISINESESESLPLSICAVCGLKRFEHIIDCNGDKLIIIEKPEKPEKQEKSTLLQDVIEKRVKSIAESETETETEIEMKSEIKEKEKEEKEEALPLQDQDDCKKCLICFDDRRLDMFSDAICGHNYCRICLSNHYKVKILSGDVLKLSCIDPKCGRLIGEEEILSYLDNEELRDKFSKFRTNKLLQLNPHCRFCCKPDCEGIMLGSRIKRKLICPICETAICFNCSQPWHGLFVGCNRHIDISYTKWALNKDVQKCPKCRMGIEKEDGCNHMTCSSCKYEFCWICKGPYNDHHFEWWNIFGCPGAQYTPRFCRCPHCFPRWLNRILIILCFLAVVVPLVVVAGLFWFIIVCLIFCVRCDFKCDIDPCDCF